MFKSKIHNAVITQKELHYAGSIGIDKHLMKESDLLPGEKVQVLNFNNGQRFETYVIEEAENSGTVALYGPAARLGEIGDKICILSYAFVKNESARDLQQKVIRLGEGNKIG